MGPKSFVKEFSGKNFYCVYHLINSENEIVYIGSSYYPSRRVYAHICSDKDFCSVEFKRLESGPEMSNTEATDIVKFNPKLNLNIPANKDFILINQAFDVADVKIKKIIRELPISFSRRGSIYISTSDLNKLMVDIEVAANKSMIEIYKSGEE